MSEWIDTIDRLPALGQKVKFKITLLQEGEGEFAGESFSEDLDCKIQNFLTFKIKKTPKTLWKSLPEPTNVKEKMRKGIGRDSSICSHFHRGTSVENPNQWICDQCGTTIKKAPK